MGMGIMWVWVWVEDLDTHTHTHIHEVGMDPIWGGQHVTPRVHQQTCNLSELTYCDLSV